MEELLKRYARLIIEVQLKLERGDSLSINTEGSTMGFARLLAKMACEATLQVVNIVETNHGKVVQVIPMDPVEHEILRPEVKGFVMCHILDLDNAPYLSEENPMDMVADVALLGSFGLLSDPVFLDRRIAVPWANIPYPGPFWAMQLLGKEASELDMWTLFASLYRLEDNHGLRFWEDQGNLLHYRKQKLNKLGRLQFSITGYDWTLQARQAKRTIWAGGRTTLANNRTFFSNLPVQHLLVSLDSNSAQGTFTSTKSFLVLGQLVEDATFIVEKGKVVSYTAKKGEHALKAYFSIDEGASIVSELSLSDNDTIESHYLTKGVHPHFNKEMTTHLVLGGFTLATLTDQDSDEDIDACDLARSLVRLEIPVGSNVLSVTALQENGDEVVLMEEGISLE